MTGLKISKDLKDFRRRPGDSIDYTLSQWDLVTRRALERRPPDVSYKQLVDVYAADTAARDPEMLQATLLPHLVKRAHVQGSFADFKRRFDESTGGLADRLRSVPGVAFAGGSVTAAICDCGFSDVDLLSKVAHPNGVLSSFIGRSASENCFPFEVIP